MCIAASSNCSFQTTSGKHCWGKFAGLRKKNKKRNEKAEESISYDTCWRMRGAGSWMLVKGTTCYVLYLFAALPDKCLLARFQSWFILFVLMCRSCWTGKRKKQLTVFFFSVLWHSGEIFENKIFPCFDIIEAACREPSKRATTQWHLTVLVIKAWLHTPITNPNY